jgi:hypothetical protein
MATPALSNNGVYIIANDGTKIALKRSVLDAIKKMVDEKGTGEVTLHFRSGGHATTSDRRVYQDG